VTLCTPQARLIGRLIYPAEATLTLSALLPAARAMADDLVASVQHHLRCDGSDTSCQASCSHCCQGYVIPLAGPEAAALWDSLPALPLASRARTMQRFADAVDTLAAAEPYQPPAGAEPHQRAESFSSWYAELGIVCPLLAEGLCSIYNERPLVCREHMVTSPPELCCHSRLTGGAKMDLPVSIAETVAQLAAELEGGPMDCVVLPMTPAWVDHHARQARQRYPARQLVDTFVSLLSRRAQAPQACA